MITLLIIALVVILIFLKMYLFNVYESKITFNPSKDSYNINDEVTIELSELNGFGSRIPFASKPYIEINVLEGKELIALRDLPETKIIAFKKEGIVKLSFITKNSLMPIYKEIKIN